MGGIGFLKYWHEVNKIILKAALHHCKDVTLDIDATEIIAHKSSAKWTYSSSFGVKTDNDTKVTC
jgi:hypothetical protein